MNRYSGKWRCGRIVVMALLAFCLLASMPERVLAQAAKGRAGIDGIGAPQPEAPGKGWAVIVGIDQYANPEISPLGGAVNDARALSGTLGQVLGIPKERMFPLHQQHPSAGAIFPARTTSSRACFM